VRRGVQNLNNEPMKLTKSRTRKPEAGAVARQAGVGGKRRQERRAFTALSGWEIGKTWNFYRLTTGFSPLRDHLNPAFPTVLDASG